MTFPLEKLSLYFILISFLAVPAVFGQNFPEKPNPQRLVNDYAKILSSSEASNLEGKLVNFDRTSSSQIAIVTIKSTEGYPISSYAFELGEKWGIGQKGKDNGILILVALNDREVYIATGYGLEGAVPDALAKRIIENTIKPQFKKENYYGGLSQATDILIKLTKGEYTADQVNKMYQSKKSFSRYLPFLFILLFIGISFISRYSRYKSYRRSNIGTGSITFWAWLMLMSSQGRSRGNWHDFNSGGGSFGGGGGFGGFGGGSFGGGGAGGSW